MPDSNAATASMPMLEGIDIEAPVAEHNDDSDSDSLDVDLSGLADFADSDEPADPKMDIDSTLNQLDNTGEFLKPEDVEDMSKTIAGGGDEPADPIGDNDATVLANTGAFEGFADLADGISDATAALPEIAAEDFAGLADETAEQPAPDVDANSTEATVEQPEVVAEDFSDDAGAGGMPEDATMTEVGTKLDLARAYIDMGDPDGARSILSEVMDEGGEPQQQEARQLLEELGD
jgi:pilus assembly protein FimV